MKTTAHIIHNIACNTPPKRGRKRTEINLKKLEAACAARGITLEDFERKVRAMWDEEDGNTE